ncbi:MAG TPA: aminotransferase class III-fold pyridoxal phosphate-dependent enzyme [Solirubrobacteraceae bacterium]|nr:aminotransferase class III-fold pyridoxal phosphate-dependent enzyme [Solirubrobacteraceae bacterium]
MTVADVLPATNAEGFELIARHLSPHKARAYQEAGLGLVQGRREGVRVWDLEGRDYINCRSSGGVFNFGHHPRFAVEALASAVHEHDMGDWLLPSARRARGAAALARLLPEPLRYSFFTASGAEAVEVACKLARSVTGRTGLVCAEHGYHGHVGFSLAMDDPPLSDRYRPLTPGIERVPFDDAAAAERAIGPGTAAVIMETIPATGGYLVPSAGYLATLRRLCDDRGALLILDEVQTGLGRTGRLWAFEHFGVVPDMLVTGKGTSAGVYPIAACCFGDRVEAHFAEDPFFHPSSYAGSELGARVLEAAVERYEDPALLAHVEAMGERLAAGLDGLIARHPDRLAARRGLGLMLALETHSAAQGLALTQACFAHGLLALFAFNRQSTLQIMPPLVISADEVDEVLERLAAAVAAIGVA